MANKRHYFFRKPYGTTSHSMTPNVNATITPITIAFDAIFLDRINNTIMDIAAVAEISAAGAINHGTSCANQASVFMATPL